MAKPYDSGAPASSPGASRSRGCPVYPLRLRPLARSWPPTSQAIPRGLQQDHIKRLTSIDPGWCLALEQGAHRTA